MPITEVPTSAPERPPEPPVYRRRSRYEDLDAHELFHLIEEYEDERARARLRESIWISIIFYMLLGWFLMYGIRFLPNQAHVIDPSMAMKNRTYLDLPPDLEKNIKPKPTDKISDKNRTAQSKHPTPTKSLDKKTLEQLQAMRRANPQPAPEPPAPQPAQQQPETPKPTQPIPPNPQSNIEAPVQQAPSKPNFSTPNLSPGDALAKAARDAARGGGGDFGAGDTPGHQGVKAGAEILSDTLGVDFGPYMAHIIRETQHTWDPLVPEAARPPLLKRGIVQIQFIIMPDGRVKSMRLIGPSGDVSLDRAAWGAITGSNYPQLPREFKGPYLELRFAFFYNEKPGVE
jgi:outer membrane biosynthesis protein TonB